MFTVRRLETKEDLLLIRSLISRLPWGTSVVDFEEKMLITAVRAKTILWMDGPDIAAFSLVDDYNNLWFDLDPEYSSNWDLAGDIVRRGVDCIRARIDDSEEPCTLDAVCDTGDTARKALLEGAGFTREEIRSLQYVRLLDQSVKEYPLPEGFSIRVVKGDQEVVALVALHRAAFGTDHMTVEERLAIMHAPEYEPDLDFVVSASNGELAAFCICGFEDASRTTGYTDPIGTHPRYQRLGLARAVVTHGLRELQSRGGKIARLGTSSENLPMQALATALDFSVSAERVWFSKNVVPLG